MVVVDEMWENPEYHDFINSKLKQLASAFNYLKCAGFSDDDIIEIVNKMLPHVPSYHLARYVTERGSNE